MEEIKYSIYKPAGNDTALVYGLNYTQEQKKQINNKIMELLSTGKTRQYKDGGKWK